MEYATEGAIRPSDRRAEYIRGFGILLLIAVVGLFIVKWSPYWQKLFTLIDHPTAGSSIIYGKDGTPPPASLQAAWDYATRYFQAIWQAMVLGLLLAATIETLVPRDWLARVLGSAGWRSAAAAGLLSLPGMMCTCCCAPVALGLRKKGASTPSAVAFFLGNPTLNPAVLAFLLVTLGWQWAALRLVLGVVLVAGLAYLSSKITPQVGALPGENVPAIESDGAGQQNLALAWLRSFGRLAIRLIPEYIVIVALLGAARAFLFPAIGPIEGTPLLMIGLAVVGTLFVIPTAGEIPVVAAMLAAGMGAGPAGVLLLTLAPVSLPSLTMVSKAFPRSVLALLAGGTMLVGLAAGVLAAVLALPVPSLK